MVRETLDKLSKKDPQRSKSIYEKITEIIECNESTINHYKNLRHDLSDYKRVYIDKNL